MLNNNSDKLLKALLINILSQILFIGRHYILNIKIECFFLPYKIMVDRTANFSIIQFSNFKLTMRFFLQVID